MAQTVFKRLQTALQKTVSTVYKNREKPYLSIKMVKGL